MTPDAPPRRALVTRRAARTRARGRPARRPSGGTCPSRRASGFPPCSAPTPTIASRSAVLMVARFTASAAVRGPLGRAPPASADSSADSTSRSGASPTSRACVSRGSASPPASRCAQMTAARTSASQAVNIPSAGRPCPGRPATWKPRMTVSAATRSRGCSGRTCSRRSRGRRSAGSAARPPARSGSRATAGPDRRPPGCCSRSRPTRPGAGSVTFRLTPSTRSVH